MRYRILIHRVKCSRCKQYTHHVVTVGTDNYCLKCASTLGFKIKLP